MFTASVCRAQQASSPGQRKAAPHCPLKVSAKASGMSTTNYHPHLEWLTAAAAAAKSLQSCPTLYDPIDGSPTGSPVPGILQAKTLEWVTISFSNAWKWKVKVKSLNHVRLLATPWTAAHQAPPSMGFSRREYWRNDWLPSSKSIKNNFLCQRPGKSQVEREKTTKRQHQEGVRKTTSQE